MNIEQVDKEPSYKPGTITTVNNNDFTYLKADRDYVMYDMVMPGPNFEKDFTVTPVVGLHLVDLPDTTAFMGLAKGPGYIDHQVEYVVYTPHINKDEWAWFLTVYLNKPSQNQ